MIFRFAGLAVFIAFAATPIAAQNAIGNATVDPLPLPAANDSPSVLPPPPPPSTAPVSPASAPVASTPAAPTATGQAATQTDAAAVTAPTPKETELRALASSSATADVKAAQAIEKASPIPEGALEVTASGTLEWLREDQMYVARGNAMARHNGTFLKGDVLVAHYVEPPPGPNGKKGSSQITLVTAEGNPVEVIAPTAVAYGQHGTYDVDKHLIVLLGDNLKLVTTDEVVTAKDSLKYYEDQDTGVATGDAVLIRGDDKLTADVISAKFVHNTSADTKAGDKGKAQPVKTAQGPAQPPTPAVDVYGDPVKPHSLESMHAQGHVVLVTQTDVVTGDEGFYNPITDQTTILGNVRVTRDQNQMDGTRAEVDMATGISKMFAPPGGKVHGLFVPKKKEPKEKSASADLPTDTAKNGDQ